jgi:hypothetical protein
MPQVPLQQAVLLPLQMLPEVMQHLPAMHVLYMQQSPGPLQLLPVTVQHVDGVLKPTVSHLRPVQQPEMVPQSACSAWQQFPELHVKW